MPRGREEQLPQLWSTYLVERGDLEAAHAQLARGLGPTGPEQSGRILEPTTLATMFGPHYQPDRRIPGMGLGFFRGDLGGHRIVGHDGILPGFDSALVIAPDDGIGVFAFTNGSSGAFSWLQIELERLLRESIGITEAPDPRRVAPRACHRKAGWSLSRPRSHRHETTTTPDVSPQTPASTH